MRALLAFILLALSTAAFAQFNRCGPGFCPGGDFGRGFRPPSSGGVAPGSNFLLSDTGSALLVDVGSKFLVQ